MNSTLSRRRRAWLVFVAVSRVLRPMAGFVLGNTAFLVGAVLWVQAPVCQPPLNFDFAGKVLMLVALSALVLAV